VSFGWEGKVVVWVVSYELFEPASLFVLERKTRLKCQRRNERFMKVANL